MKIYLKGNIKITDIGGDVKREIQKALTMDNPKHADAEKMNRWIGDIEAHLRFYSNSENGLIVPRGFIRPLLKIAEKNGIKPDVYDQTWRNPDIDFQFSGKLRPYQQRAVDSVLSRYSGILESPTGSGKTVMALAIIAARQQPALIVVHTKELLHQWIDRIGQFLNIPPDEVGIIGNGKLTRGARVTVGMIQTVYKHAEKLGGYFGHLILDECHRAPAITYAGTIKHFDGRYILGLSATPFRRDGLGPVISWHVGPVTGKVDKSELLKNGALCHAEVKMTETGFSPTIDPAQEYSRALSELTEDDARNRAICGAVSIGNGSGISLILSDRKRHCDALAGILGRDYGIQAEILTGATPAKDRARIIADLQYGQCKYLIATGQLIGEGFDLPGISAMYLTTPIKFNGRVIQYIGRALRPAPGKDTAIIYDFIDGHPVFKASAAARLRAYRAEGINF